MGSVLILSLLPCLAAVAGAGRCTPVGIQFHMACAGYPDSTSAKVHHAFAKVNSGEFPGSVEMVTFNSEDVLRSFFCPACLAVAGYLFDSSQRLTGEWELLLERPLLAFAARLSGDLLRVLKAFIIM
jgi:hypothetical protein